MFIEFPKGTVIEGIKELNEKDLVLKDDIRFAVEVKTWFEVGDVIMNVHLGDYNLDNLKEEILLDLKANYMLYAQHSDESLTGGAKNVKDKMLEILEEVEPGGEK